MASRVDTDEEGDNKGSMWDLDQKLDQPMEEEAGRLRNMYREKVWYTILLPMNLSLPLFPHIDFLFGRQNGIFIITD